MSREHECRRECLRREGGRGGREALADATMRYGGNSREGAGKALASRFCQGLSMLRMMPAWSFQTLSVSFRYCSSLESTSLGDRPSVSVTHRFRCL